MQQQHHDSAHCVLTGWQNWHFVRCNFFILQLIFPLSLGGYFADWFYRHILLLTKGFSKTFMMELESDSSYRDNDYEQGFSEDSDSSSNFDNLSSSDNDQPLANLIGIHSRNWQDYVGRSPNIQYTGNAGLKAIIIPSDGQKVSPLDVYKKFLSEDVISLMVEETNRKAAQFLSSGQENSRMKNWKIVTEEDIWKFIGILLYMGLVRLPSVNAYWSTKSSLYNCTIIRKTMNRDKFWNILKCWHFNDDEKNLDNDRLWKVRPLIDLVIANVQNLITPGETLTVDETMIPFRGRLIMKQYMPGKRHKYGIKLFKLCDQLGITYAASVYAGKGEKKSGLNLGGKTVMKLAEPYLGEGRTVFADNFFTGIQLAEDLLKNDTYLCGTLRKERKDLPKDVIVKKLKKGEMIRKENGNGVVVQKWVDKRPVFMISTKYSGEIIDTGKKNRKGNDIWKPNTVVNYNKGKIGVDLSDMFSSYHCPLRKSLTWYKKVALEIVSGLGLVNAYLVYKHLILKEKKYSILEFRETILESLLPVKMMPKRPSLTAMHQLQKSVKEEKKDSRKRCRACYDSLRKGGFDTPSAKNKAKKVDTYCSGCGDAANRHFLCLDCFNKRHK